MDTSSKTAMFVDHITIFARKCNQRTGQYLFNCLPEPLPSKIAGTSFDPFYKHLTQQEIYEWIDNHLIFDGNEIVGLFHNNVLIWEAGQ